MAEDRCARCGSTALSPSGVCTRCGEMPRASVARAAAPTLPAGLPPGVPRPRFIPPAPPAVTPPALLPIESTLPPRPTTPPPLPETVAVATAAGEEGALDEARPFSWTWVWAAAGAVVAVAVALAGVATSWFGLAGSPSESTIAAPTSTPSSVVVDTSGVPSTEPPTTAATTVAALEYEVDPITACVVASVGQPVVVRADATETAQWVGELDPNQTGIEATGTAKRDESNEEWREIRYGGGEAWVQSYYLSPGECTAGDPRQYCVKEVDYCSGPNVRIGPQAGPVDTAAWLADGYEVIGELAYASVQVPGTGLTARDYQGDLWVQISYNGGMGWVARWLLVPEPCQPAVCTADDQ